MTNKEKITESFGVMLFGDGVMKERLNPTAYESVRLAKERGIVLMATKMRMFTACGVLYENGLGGGSDKCV